MESNDSSGFHSLGTKDKKILTTAILTLLVIVITFISFIYYKAAVERPAQGHKEATFEISEGEASVVLARRLYEEDLVNSEFLFKVYLVANGLHTNVQAGVYRIPAGSSVVELAQIFQHGTNDVRITFIEGWRVEEYARLADENFRKVDYIEFVKLAKENEGRLFPDTYFFNSDAGEEEIIERLELTFDKKTEEVLSENSLDEVNLTKDEVINLASIVEREVSDEEDRPVVAGILIKRFRNGVLIGADATTQYAAAHLQVCDVEVLGVCPTYEQAVTMDWWPKVLTGEYLDYDSPYNTRKVAGLPPKPISSPGLSAIEAVVDYKETSFNFYLTDENGITHYANTLEEHNRNVVQHL